MGYPCSSVEKMSLSCHVPWCRLSYPQSKIQNSELLVDLTHDWLKVLTGCGNATEHTLEISACQHFIVNHFPLCWNLLPLCSANDASSTFLWSIDCLLKTHICTNNSEASFCPLHNKLSSFEVFNTSWSILCELPPILQREIPISGSLSGHHHQTEEELLGYFGGASPSYIHGHPWQDLSKWTQVSQIYHRMQMFLTPHIFHSWRDC